MCDARAEEVSLVEWITKQTGCDVDKGLMSIC